MTERPTPLFSPPEPDLSTPLVAVDTRPRTDLTDLLLATAAIDHSGRIPARRLLRALDWHPDQTTTARLRNQTITIRLDAHSPHRIDSRHHVFIPAGLRDLTGIRTGDTVALLGAPQLQLLVVYPARALTTLLGTPVD